MKASIMMQEDVPGRSNSNVAVQVYNICMYVCMIMYVCMYVRTYVRTPTAWGGSHNEGIILQH